MIRLILAAVTALSFQQVLASSEIRFEIDQKSGGLEFVACGLSVSNASKNFAVIRPDPANASKKIAAITMSSARYLEELKFSVCFHPSPKWLEATTPQHMALATSFNGYSVHGKKWFKDSDMDITTNIRCELGGVLSKGQPEAVKKGQTTTTYTDLYFSKEQTEKASTAANCEVEFVLKEWSAEDRPDVNDLINVITGFSY